MDNNSKKRPQKPFDVVQIIKDRLHIILIVSIILGAAFTILTLKNARDFFTAEATLVFEKHVPEILFEEQDRFLHSFEDWIRTQVHEIESDSVLIQSINAFKNKGFNWSLPEESDYAAMGRLRGKLQVSQINNTQIMQFRMTSSQKEGLAEIINSVLSSYINFKDGQRQSKDKQKLAYLVKERKYYEARLDSSYRELMRISKQYGTAVADEKNLYIYLNMFMDLRTSYNDVLIDRIKAENKFNSLKSKKQRLVSIQDGRLAVGEMMYEVEQEIRSRMIGLQPGSMEYQKFMQMLADINLKNVEITHNKLLNAIEYDIFEHTEKYQEFLNNEKQLKEELNRTQLEVMEFNTAVLRASTKRQEIDRLIDIWNRINSRIEQIQIELFNPGRVRVLNWAVTPEFKDANKLSKKLGLFFFASMFIGLAGAVFLGYLDKSIKRPRDIYNTLGFAPTGFIVDGKLDNADVDALFLDDNSKRRNFVRELYNQISSSFSSELYKNGGGLFGFFALKDGSGTSTTALNTLALIDCEPKKKLYIDMNGRAPLSNMRFAWINKRAINSKAASFDELKQMIYRPDEVPFNVLHLGKNDLSQTDRNELDSFFKELKSIYKYIFIDGAPILAESSGHKLAQIVDVTVLIANSKKDTWAELLRGVDLLNKLGVRVLSLILNQVQFLRFGYYKKMQQAFYSNEKTGMQQNG